MSAIYLVPVDFSEAGLLAVEHAVQLAEKQQARLVLLHVVGQLADIPVKLDFNRSFNVPEYRQALHELAERDLKALDQRLPQKGPPRELMVVDGDPADLIAHTADRLGADLIILSTHGRRGFSQLVFGSVAERVVRIAPCSVLCVRPRRGAAAGAK